MTNIWVGSLNMWTKYSWLESLDLKNTKSKECLIVEYCTRRRF